MKSRSDRESLMRVRETHTQGKIAHKRLHKRLHQTFYEKTSRMFFYILKRFLRITDEFEFRIVVSIIERDTSIIETHTK